MLSKVDKSLSLYRGVAFLCRGVVTDPTTRKNNCTRRSHHVAEPRRFRCVVYKNNALCDVPGGVLFGKLLRKLPDKVRAVWWIHPHSPCPFFCQSVILFRIKPLRFYGFIRKFTACRVKVNRSQHFTGKVNVLFRRVPFVVSAVKGNVRSFLNIGNNLFRLFALFNPFCNLFLLFRLHLCHLISRIYGKFVFPGCFNNWSRCLVFNLLYFGYCIM